MKAEKKILETHKLKDLWRDLADNIINNYATTPNLVVIGIRRRGDILASRLVKSIKKRTGISVPLGILDITLYRDDFTTIGPQPVVRKTEIDFDINNKNIILVDDVLYTGRTVRAALDALIDLGRPASIRLAVLIEREGRELPIQPDYVGKKVMVGLEEIIEVRLKEFDEKEEVVVTMKNKRH